MQLTAGPALRAAAGPVAVLATPLVLTGAAASYTVRTLTAVVAAGLLWRRTAGEDPLLVRPRRLVALAASAGVLSGLLATAHVLVTGGPPPLGGLADVVYLLYAPIAVLALLTAMRSRRRGDARRALAEASVAAAALGVPVVGVLGASTSGRASLSALLYPLAAVFVLAVLLAVLPRAHPGLRPFLHLAAPGLALVAVSDLGYGYAASHGWSSPTGWPAVVNQLGIAVLLVAATARRTPRPARHGRTWVVLLEPAAAYVPVLPLCVYVLVLWSRGEDLASAQLPVLAALGLALVVRHVLASSEQQRSVADLSSRERQASAAARCDSLTGLANRGALHDRLVGALSDPARPPVVLVLLDLDDFKDINDRHGHQTGDAVLRHVAERLRGAVPATAVVARLGGDEFALLVVGSSDAEAIGRDAVQALAAPLAIGTRRFTVSASIGIVGCTGGTATGSLSDADVAMYQAKSSKAPQVSRVVVLAGQARVRASARVQLREEVSTPDLTQFRVVYQPVVHLATGRLAGAEALLRWRHPVLGDIGPAEFVPLAEQVGGIAALGEHALRTAAGDLAGWLAQVRAAGREVGRAGVGVNLSPRQLGAQGLVDLVASVLAEHELEPHRLSLEITESALVGDWDTAVEVVRSLRALGVHVAVDDFGTGYSSLRYLRRFDTSIVKIDREFVQGLADEERTRALVGSVLAMAASLHLHTVAEGVETLDQLRVLRTLGCAYGQGFLFDRPLEPEAYGELVLAGHVYPVVHPVVADEPAGTTALPQRAPSPRGATTPSTARAQRR